MTEPSHPPLSHNYDAMDYLREKLWGAASDCNVRLEQDQVGYILRAVLGAMAKSGNAPTQQPSADVIHDSETADIDPIGDAHAKGYAEGYKARALLADEQREALRSISQRMALIQNTISLRHPLTTLSISVNETKVLIDRMIEDE